MASLILNSEGLCSGGVFRRRVLIGRKPFNAIQFENRAISRIHAWIDCIGDLFYVADAHSRGGVTVNGQKITAKHTLHDGDVIGIVHEQITFHQSDQLPPDCLVFDIADDGSNPAFDHNGILTQCDCGAPLWVPSVMAGAFGHCAVCKGEITVPGTPLTGTRRPLSPNDSLVDEPALADLGSIEKPADPLAADHAMEAIADEPTKIVSPPGQPAFPRPQPAAAMQHCKVCQHPVLAGQPAQTCPACGQIHHAQCWEKNGGCASYGCTHSAAPQSDVPPVRTWQEQVPATVAKLLRPPSPLTPTIPITWDIALLGGSLFGLILGAFTFGVPTLAVGTASAVYAIRRRDAAGRVAALSAAICVIGVPIGVIISSLLWLSRPR